MGRVKAALFVAAGLLASVQQVAANVNIDGGRSQLPGMKQDMFEQAKINKKGNLGQKKGPPECPKSDKMSPFYGLAFVNGDVYVKVNSTEDTCVKLDLIGGANYTTLINASRTCGPAGEWKRRIAEELSAVFFQSGLEWVKHENETIEIVTEEGTYEIEVNEERYHIMSECWARGCGCEQAANPTGRVILFTLLAIGIGGLMSDSIKLAWGKYKGTKPGKHVLSRKGHRMEEVKFAKTHVCDVCGNRGTCYQCSAGSPYDMCKACYKAAKKKLKTELEAWYEKHPEDKKADEEKKKAKKAKGEKGDSDGDDDKKSEAESTTKAESEGGDAESKAESSKPDEDEDDGKAEEK